MIKCVQFLTNHVDSLQLLKHASLHHAVDNLKLRPIIDLTGTYTYNSSKVIANYSRPLSKNRYTISDTLKFPDLLKRADTNANYEDVSYNVELLFNSIPVAETIEYILKRI